MSHNPNPWSELSPLEAQEFHEAYVAAHPVRLDRFVEDLARAGFASGALDYTSMAMVDQVWEFAIEHLDPPWKSSDNTNSAGWYPTLAEFAVPATWPAWEPSNTLSPGGLEFVSGLAACIAEVMLRSWQATWTVDPGDSEPWNPQNRTCLAVSGEGNYHVESSLARWYERRGHQPRGRMWFGLEDSRAFRAMPLDTVLADVEVERFDPDDMMPNWFHATISPEFTAQINRLLIDRFVAELQNQPSVAEAHQSDTEWVAVKSRRKRSEKHMQKVVDDAWSIAKAAHPRVLDHHPPGRGRVVVGEA